MNLDNTYEKLVQDGYIEAGTLVIPVDDLTRLEITDEQVKPDGINIERHDKGVIIYDKAGRMKKVSSILLGKNKNNVQLGDGNFVNSDELLAAMEEAISKLDQGTIIINKKGEILNPDDLLMVAKEAAGKIIIGEKSDKITNQDTKTWQIEGAKSDKTYNKGVVFLGNGGIELKTGDYISSEEFINALNEYIILKPKEQEIIPIIEQPQPKMVRVTSKYKNRLSAWLIALATTLILTSGISIKDNVRTYDVPVEVQNQIVSMIEQDQLNFDLNELEHNLVYESPEQSVQRIISNLKIGDLIEAKNGDVLYSNSLLKGNTLTIGEGIRKEGNYSITGVSIVQDSNMLSWIEDYALQNPGADLGSFIEQACKKYNLSFEDISVRLHLGSSINSTRSGWIDATKLIRADQIDAQVIQDIVTKGSSYTGTQDNFNNSTLTISTLDGDVTLKVVDENGNLLKPGSIVIGSNGKEYQISNLSQNVVQKEVTQNITTTEMRQVEVNEGKSLSWSIEDCELALGIAPLVGALAAAMVNKKKNEDSQENPTLFQFENDEQYLKFKEEFEKAKVEYEKKSGFKKMIKNVFFRKEVDVMQQLTSEQTSKIYTIIQSCNTEEYTYSPTDRIEFRNGRIVVTNIDGITKDITEVVLPGIASIGSENQIISEGRLEIGDENGIHRR